MNILYIITILIIYTLIMLLHKTEKKQNAISWIAISAILILCYNILICLILTFVGTLCTLGNLSICNAFIALMLAGILIKGKKIQKYYIKVSDIVFLILLLILVIFIAYKQYGFPFNLKYKITDASTHYYYAEQFYEHSTLLYKIEGNSILEIYDSDFRLPGAYINEGIIFKTFDGIISKTDLFILFDLLILYLSGILFYYLLKTYVNQNKKMQVLAAIFSIFYMLGYQLNSMLYGYVYLSLALDIIITFLLVMTNHDKNEISNKMAWTILSILSFGIFFSYAYFIPIIYIAIIVNIIIKSVKNNEDILSENNLMELMLVLIIPLILGLTYFVILPNAKGIESEISTIGVDGVTYKNYITNLLYFAPIFITGVVLAIKNKKKEINLSTILFVLSILFAIILFIGKKIGIVSEYYFFKAYYIIWSLAICNVYVILCRILESKNKKLRVATYIYTSIYVIVIIAVTFIGKSSIGINDIFYHNAEYINHESYTLKNEELKIMQKIEEGSTIYTFPPKAKGRARWMAVLLENEYIQLDYEKTIENWETEREEKYYFAYHKDYSKIEENYLNEDNTKYKIIYNDEYGFILERK